MLGQIAAFLLVLSFDIAHCPLSLQVFLSRKWSDWCMAMAIGNSVMPVP